MRHISFWFTLMMLIDLVKHAHCKGYTGVLLVASKETGLKANAGREMYKVIFQQQNDSIRY
jgi:hypothetical protein